MRVGLGFDAHAFGDGRDLVLGGVVVPYDRGLHGHSDADVVSHAVGDAALGAAGLGDLGEHFPATAEWKDASSLSILQAVSRALTEAGQRVANVDATVIAQAPRLSAHIGLMRTNLAAALGIDADLVSVKATTTDHMGFTGRGEGIAAMAVVLVEPVV